MSQQMIPIVSIQEDVAEMGDLEFIQGKVEAGVYFHVITDISDLGDKAVKIVDDGKTAFLIEAKITMIANPSAVSVSSGALTSSDQIVATLQKNESTVITEFSKAKIGVSTSAAGANRIGSGSGFGVNSESHFNVLGFSLLGSGVNNIIEIENTLDNTGSAVAEFSGYLV